MPTRKFSELIQAMPTERQQSIQKRFEESLATMPSDELRKAREIAQIQLDAALVLEAHRQGLSTEAELGQFLRLTRLSRDRFLKDHGIDLAYSWEDLELERKMHRDIAGA